MNALASFTPNEVIEFGKGLEKHFHGRMQYRDGQKTDVNYYCVVRVTNRAPFILEGHISGRTGTNARFSVQHDPVSQRLFIHVKPEAPQGFKREQALVEISRALAVMMKRVEAGPIEGQMGTKHWRGYYVINLGAKTIGKEGLKRFDEAVQLGLISSAFKDICIEYGFTMMKRPKD